MVYNAWVIYIKRTSTYLTMTNELEHYIKSYFGVVQQSDLQKINALLTLKPYKKSK